MIPPPDQLKNNYEFIASGAGKIVYKLTEHLVVKLSKDKDMRKDADRQTEFELHVYQRCPPDLRYLLCPIVAYRREGKKLMLLMPRMKQLGGDQIRQLKAERGTRQVGGPTLLETYQGDRQAAKDIEKLCSKFNLRWIDLLEVPRNWGILPGRKVKLLDYGYRG